MGQAHRDGDNRACGATTTVVGQSTVFVNTKLWAVVGDPNTDGGGGLIASGTTVFINGINVIINGDSASADSLCIPLGGAHCAPSATSGSGDVGCYS